MIPLGARVLIVAKNVVGCAVSRTETMIGYVSYNIFYRTENDDLVSVDCRPDELRVVESKEERA